MSPEVTKVLLAAFVVWGGAVAWKAWTAIRKNEPYTFSMWDGGMLRAGKRLTSIGAKIKLVIGLVMSLGCIVFLTGVMPREALYVVIGAAAISIISDLANSEG